MKFKFFTAVYLVWEFLVKVKLTYTYLFQKVDLMKWCPK